MNINWGSPILFGLWYGRCPTCRSSDSFSKDYENADLDEDDWVQTRLDQFNLIDEKRLYVVCHGQMYQKV